MTALLIVRAIVPEADRKAFDTWYEKEHLPDAKSAFKAISAQRGWCEEDPQLHIAFYQFPNLARANEITESDEVKTMIAEFDRVWQERVVRSREVVEIRQSI